MGRKYLGGSGSALTVWVSLAASTVLIFYGYDQVYCLSIQDFQKLTLSKPGRLWQCVSSFSQLRHHPHLTHSLSLVGQDFLRTMGHPTATQQGTLTSVYNLGCFGGALSTLYTGDKLGRPRTLMLGSFIIALGAIIQASSYSRGQMYAGRVIAGLGTGMNTATAGEYIEMRTT
jgi:MFS family permease